MIEDDIMSLLGFGAMSSERLARQLRQGHLTVFRCLCQFVQESKVAFHRLGRRIYFSLPGTIFSADSISEEAPTTDQQKTMLEKLLETLAALIAAINANTAALKSGKGSKTDPKAESPAAAPAGPTVADVRAVATQYIDATKNQGTLISDLAKEFKVARISEAPADKFPEIIARLKKGIEAAAAAPATTDAI